MAVFLRGKIWWYELEFHGKIIRESSHSRSENRARQLERERRRRLEISLYGRVQARRPLLFHVAAQDWFDSSLAHWSESSVQIQQSNLGHLVRLFSDRHLNEIATSDIMIYLATRMNEGASKREVNMEVATLRAILRKARFWEAQIKT